jgi:hypothetical protein
VMGISWMDLWSLRALTGTQSVTQAQLTGLRHGSSWAEILNKARFKGAAKAAAAEALRLLHWAGAAALVEAVVATIFPGFQAGTRCTNRLLYQHDSEALLLGKPLRNRAGQVWLKTWLLLLQRRWHKPWHVPETTPSRWRGRWRLGGLRWDRGQQCRQAAVIAFGDLEADTQLRI